MFWFTSEKCWLDRIFLCVQTTRPLGADNVCSNKFSSSASTSHLVCLSCWTVFQQNHVIRHVEERKSLETRRRVGWLCVLTSFFPTADYLCHVFASWYMFSSEFILNTRFWGGGVKGRSSSSSIKPISLSYSLPIISRIISCVRWEFSSFYFMSYSFPATCFSWMMRK